MLGLFLQLSQSPYMYDNHVELLKILKSLGDLEQLREARTHMSKLFPLTEGTNTGLQIDPGLFYG